jgi:hypothetical protein
MGIDCMIVAYLGNLLAVIIETPLLKDVPYLLGGMLKCIAREVAQ